MNVKEANGWQLEMVFVDQGVVPKFGFFGRIYTRAFNKYFYRNTANFSRTLMYSLPMPRADLEHWGVQGGALVELELLGMFMRPEISMFEQRFRRVVGRSRTASKPMREAMVAHLLGHGVRREEMHAEWGSRPQHDKPELRQVACRMDVLRPLTVEVRQAVLDVARASATVSAELTWSPYTNFDLEEIRAERFGLRSSVASQTALT
jgi:hypothetical protein